MKRHQIENTPSRKSFCVYCRNSPGINTSQLGWMCLLKWSQKAPERKITFVGTWKHSWILILGTVGDTNRHDSGCLEGELESSSPGDLVASTGTHTPKHGIHAYPNANKNLFFKKNVEKGLINTSQCQPLASIHAHTGQYTCTHTHNTYNVSECECYISGAALISWLIQKPGFT